MSAWKMKYLEKEFNKALKTGNKNIWTKKDHKRIAKKLDFEEAKVYKWCWEQRKKVKKEQADQSKKPTKKITKS